MNVISTLWISEQATTGLPSLLSSQFELPQTAEIGTVAKPEDSTSDPTVQPFEALLALFGNAPNLPLPQLADHASVEPSELVDSVEPTDPVSQSLDESLIVTAIPIALPVAIEEIKPAMAFVKPPLMPSQQPIAPSQQPLLDQPPATVSQPDRQTSDSVENVFAEPEQVDATHDEPAVTELETKSIPPALEPRQLKSTSMLAQAVRSDAKEFSDSRLDRSSRLTTSHDGRVDESGELQSDRMPLPQEVLTAHDYVSEFTETFRRESPTKEQLSDPQDANLRPEPMKAHAVLDFVSHSTSGAEPHSFGQRQLNHNAIAETLVAALPEHRRQLESGLPAELHLRLDPPELGLVRVHLKLSDDVVSVRFIAGDEAVTRMLESRLPDLRQSLAERGLNFSHGNLSHSDRQQNTPDDQRSTGHSTFVFDHGSSRRWQNSPRFQKPISAQRESLDVLA